MTLSEMLKGPLWYSGLICHLIAMLAFHIRVLVQVPAALLLLQLPATVPGKAVNNAQLDAVLGPWFLPGPIKTVTAVCEVNQDMENLFLSLPSISAVLPQKIFLKQKKQAATRWELRVHMLRKQVPVYKYHRHPFLNTAK